MQYLLLRLLHDDNTVEEILRFLVHDCCKKKEKKKNKVNVSRRTSYLLPRDCNLDNQSSSSRRSRDILLKYDCSECRIVQLQLHHFFDLIAVGSTFCLFCLFRLRKSLDRYYILCQREDGTENTF